jgi:hypothetical protein
MEITTYLDHETQTIDLLSMLEATGDIPPGSLMLLLADNQARLMLPVGIDDVPEDPPQDERNVVLRHATAVLAHLDQCAGLTLAIGRFGDPKPRGSDYGWHDALVLAADGSQVVAHGTYVVTPSGVRRVRPFLAPPEMLAAA